MKKNFAYNIMYYIINIFEHINNLAKKYSTIISIKSFSFSFLNEKLLAK